ncbi:glycosyltransferase involved in cell wall biosynthesis [Phenylobacterium haematophilum]|jgi:glycosyltransferase involved in cell wall biosynthesis|uniref:Glycosyltransferase involved in cell wall biosynthesis n=1 Tax=Phenylobacterium haematophilum TaxID=98513 RepID=A0A839ZXD1_9CAUL|nr:glycosyltransferase family 4 protein [Phenylobacterium haematophilum]MBB3891175.1 glycosyltransferase involved in cell wall biosynthesis [Phenylobacterium haematophilum]
MQNLVTLPPDFTLLQVVPELETGGAEQTTIDVANAVVRAGGKALVATRGGRMAARLEADGGRLAQMPVQTKNPLVMLGNAARLVDLIRKEKVSIVHARSRAPAFSALWAAQATKTPFVATYHGVYGAKNSVKRWYNAVMTRGDLVIANSDYTRDHVLAEHKLDPARIVSIPRGIDLERFNPSWVTPERVQALREAWGVEARDRRVKLLLAGRLTRIKGHLLIIEAAKRMRAAGVEDFLILFAGDDQGRTGYREEVEATVVAAGLAEHVRLVGHCDDMPAAYQICDIAMLPTTKPESFGRTAVEPQVMGKPVLASDHGGTTETVLNGETGWLVKVDDPDAWAAAMGKAIEMGGLRLAAMGQAAANRARRLYSVDAMCEATLDAYARVLAARHAGSHG